MKATMKMISSKWALPLFAAAVLLGLCTSVFAQALTETRYCGPPRRDAAGVIIRRADVIAAYKWIHPCPSTGLYGPGACKGWALNHDKPLACGGCDSVSNLSYMRADAKAIVDSYERKINAAKLPYPDTAACVNKVLP